MSNLERRIQSAASRTLIVDVDAADTEKALRTFDGRLRQRRRRRVAAGAATTFVVAAAITFVSIDRPSSNHVVVQPVAIEATDDAPSKLKFAQDQAGANRVVYFSDGSHAELIKPRTELRMEAFSEDLLELTLAVGEAQFDVAPSSRRLFRVRTQDMRIEVLGTSFTVANDEETEEEHVTVHRGRVAVYLDESRHELSAGMSLTWDGARAVIENDGEGEDAEPTKVGAAVESTSDEIAENTAEPERIKKRKKRRRRRRVRRARRERRDAVVREAVDPQDETPPIKVRWKRLAQDGDFAAAYEELNAAPAPAKRDTRELMLAADVARLSGHPREAVKYLDVVVEEHRGHPRALLAAFTLGRILQRELDEPQRAAEAFRTARALGPTGSLAEDALAHEAECWSRAGFDDRAKNLAAEYVRLHPEGRKIGTMRRLSGAK